MLDRSSLKSGLVFSLVVLISSAWCLVAATGHTVRPPISDIPNGEPQTACGAGMLVYESERGR